MSNVDRATQITEATVAAGLDPKVEEGREPPPYVLHRSIGLWQPPPATWEATKPT